ncbi:MAG: diguanylate cyclase, partial [Rectinema sp.]|nr:diguanylate cyclase [Rectinema sp.]
IQKNQELFVANNKLKEALDNIITLQRNYRLLLETNQDSILVYDKEGVIRYANPAAHALFSKENTPLTGTTIENILRDPKEREIEITDPFGNTVYLDVRSVATDWDNETMTLSVYRDITESTQLRKELEQMSLTDDLTGLYNRRGFKILSERVIKMARRLQANMFIMFCDMDGLKAINDTLGHLEGDNAIRTIAGFMKISFRESDLVARLGGDEFAVMGLINENFIPERLIGRLKDHIEEFNSKGTAAFTLSMSMGIEIIPYDTKDSVETFISQADGKMYVQKQERHAAAKKS